MVVVEMVALAGQEAETLVEQDLVTVAVAVHQLLPQVEAVVDSLVAVVVES
jgi:hypothetical protein